MAEFVNPYSFVPFPSDIQREPPAGHDRRLPNLLSGQIDVSLTCLSPLLIRGFDKDKLSGIDVPPHDPSGELFIPGSSLHGALRSLHETIAGGCLRVFDETFVPVYRSQVQPLGAEYRLAVVSLDPTKGSGVGLQLCDDVVEVDHRSFLVAGGAAMLRSGARLNLSPLPFPDLPMGRGGRRRYAGLVEYDRSGAWVVLVTDTRARNRHHPCYFVVGKVVANDRLLVEDEVLKDFRDRVAGADDLRPGQVAAPNAEGQIGVHWPQEGPVIGFRDAAKEQLRQGQVLWARVRGRSVISLQLAQVWRERGTGMDPYNDPERARVPATLRGCTDPNDLCISCRLFGSADTRASEDGQEAVQSSYRGHVRVLDAHPVGAHVDDHVYTLSALGSPRPGAGQFYLTNTSDRPAALRQIPARQWGAAADLQTPRKLRGRKMYWTTTWSDLRRRRAEAIGDNAGNAMVSQAKAVVTGSTFTTSLMFENLSPVELGSLLAALDPNRWARATGRDQQMAVRLGGGKPLGFGVVQSEVTQLRIDHSHSRWLGMAETDQEAEIAGLVKDFVANAPQPVEETWINLAHLLEVDFVDPNLVQYPMGTADIFDFWGNSIGQTQGRQTVPLIRLPDASGDSSAQVIDGRSAIPTPNPPQGQGRR